jgi:phage gp36-like protein
VGTAYADHTDLPKYAGPSAAFSSISTADQDAECEEVSREFDSYFAAHYPVPLATWGSDLRAKVARVAAYRLLVRLGFDSGDDGSSFRRAAEGAMAWVKDIAAGRAVISGGVTDPAPARGPRVSTTTPRGV